MKLLTDDLKRMLNALALQDAADYLPMREKMRALSSSKSARSVMHAGGTPSPSRRVALLSNGHNCNETLHYALTTSHNHEASLDLVLYGDAREEVEELRQQLEASGISYEIILLGSRNVESLTDYLNSRQALSYLVASKTDPLALELTQKSPQQKRGRQHLPIVLVGHSPQNGVIRLKSINAA